MKGEKNYGSFLRGKQLKHKRMTVSRREVNDEIVVDVWTVFVKEEVCVWTNSNCKGREARPKNRNSPRKRITSVGVNSIYYRA